MERTKHMQKLKKLLNDREQMMELIRYFVAGVLTTLLSLVITYGFEILLSENHTINGANIQNAVMRRPPVPTRPGGSLGTA